MNLWKFGEINSGFRISSPLELDSKDGMGIFAVFTMFGKSLCACLSAIHCMSLKYSILLHCVLVTNDPIEITVPSISQHETATLAYGS